MGELTFNLCDGFCHGRGGKGPGEWQQGKAAILREFTADGAGDHVRSLLRGEVVFANVLINRCHFNLGIGFPGAATHRSTPSFKHSP
ncbi:hypothetical protein D3C79_1000760 [compost metagenome]